MTIAPRLQTARLTLVGHVPGDLAEMAAMWAEPAVYAHIGGRAFDREVVWQRLLRYIGHWSMIGYGQWLLRETTTGRLVGEAGLSDTRRATVPNFEGTPECGWALATWAHGRGFAREAVEAVLGWADARGIGRTACIIDPPNTASIKLAERVGYVLVAEGRYRDEPTLLYGRDAP